jgi:hypothetical protein
MDAHQFFAGHGEHIEGIVVAQVGFDRKRKFRKVGVLFEIGRVHAGFVESASVMGDVVVGMRQRPCEAF